ncbi:hypothetical protein Sxan_22610 [Streptomyces xanthophaeus]|uniref:Uncharacterized protein n=1 Tax=Streptomyces xanthophaeus TaxID=67385 RepID=A0A919GUL1_9ACTN|nr:hypothetical protein Sxan_22610 [Streptomyces xanthophaeus]
MDEVETPGKSAISPSTVRQTADRSSRPEIAAAADEAGGDDPSDAGTALARAPSLLDQRLHGGFKIIPLPF